MKARRKVFNSGPRADIQREGLAGAHPHGAKFKVCIALLPATNRLTTSQWKSIKIAYKMLGVPAKAKLTAKRNQIEDLYY